MIVTLHSHLDLLVAVVILISLIIRCKPCNYLMPMEDKVSLRVLQHNKSIIKQLNLIANLFHKQRPKRIRISRTIIFQYLLLFDNNFFILKMKTLANNLKHKSFKITFIFTLHNNSFSKKKKTPSRKTYIYQLLDS